MSTTVDVRPETTSCVTLPAYGALIGERRLVPSSSSRYLAIEQHLFFDLMIPHLTRIPFEEEWYLDTYPDVREAIAAGQVAGARQHYVRYGYYEHRLPRRIEVDEEWYLEAHKDVREAVARGHFTSGQEHFVTIGFQEGRLPYRNFRLHGTP